MQKPDRSRERIASRTNNIAAPSKSAPIPAIGYREKRKGSSSGATRNNKRARPVEKGRSCRRWPETKNASRPRSAREEQIQRESRAAPETRPRFRRRRRDETKSRTSR